MASGAELSTTWVKNELVSIISFVLTSHFLSYDRPGRTEGRIYLRENLSVLSTNPNLHIPWYTTVMLSTLI